MGAHVGDTIQDYHTVTHPGIFARCAPLNEGHIMELRRRITQNGGKYLHKGLSIWLAPDSDSAFALLTALKTDEVILWKQPYFAVTVGEYCTRSRNIVR